ncbi:MAG: cytochrome c biogenesis protein ResB [Candidatus Nitrospinota bacterium M3_3B_026]
MTIIEALASLRFSLVLIALLSAGAMLASYDVYHAGWLVGPPMALLAVNLAAAIAANPVFRRQTPLLIFHLALLFVVVFAALGRLCYLKGHVEVAEGTPMNPALAGYENGPLHFYKLDEVKFVNAGFKIEYGPDREKGKTLNRVVYQGPGGERREALIGDQVPLEIGGYKFYTTSNKGFAPVFTWAPADGSPPATGSVHLPSYPRYEKRQAIPWEIPGAGLKVFTMLVVDEPVIASGKVSRFRPPEKHHVIARVGDETKRMKPGDRLELPGGTLVYRELRTWMGYGIYSDWTLPWLFAACAVAAVSLGWYFWDKFAASPWMREEGARLSGGAS